MSTLPIKSLLRFLENGHLKLCQQFVWFNPAKLPGPAQWVTINRTRVKDSYTNIWWMSKTENPKANNRNVLQEYSKSMKKLIKSGKFNAGKRPSEHNVSEEFFTKDNNGSIPNNVLISSNTASNSRYQKYCKSNSMTPHPARMPEDIPMFFIKLLTDPDDLVMDPFGGSNTTGAISQQLERRWVTVEADE